MNRLLSSVLVFLSLTVSATAQRATNVAAEISSPTSYVPQPFDVLGYDATLDLTQAPSTAMTGVCDIKVAWPGDPASGPFYFHLRDLNVDSVFYNGQRVEATAVGEASSPTYHYEVMSPASVKQGDTVTIRIYYNGMMTSEPGSPSWGGVSSTGGSLFAMGVGIYNNYVSATQHWLPCYDHPSDKATFHGRFIVMNNYSVASNGLLKLEPNVPESGMTTYEWTHNVPCATYLYTFAVDRYVPVEFGDAALPMQVWSRPSDTAATRITFKLLPNMVQGFAKRFGAYPFEKVGYVNTPIGAMEHETMISFPTFLSTSRDTTNPTGAHELAHQWFGDLVSPLDFRHAWLNESFAEFAETVWFEELRGWNGYLDAQTGKINGYLNNDAPREKVFALYDFPRTRPSSNYPTTIYSKGAAVVGMLRYELGDSVFFAAMRDYLSRHAYGTATTEDLRAVLEEHAGRSLEWFFNQWVYGKGWPQLDISVVSYDDVNNNGANLRTEVTIQQIQPDSMGSYINVPVEIGLDVGGGNYEYHIIKLDSGTTRRSFPGILGGHPTVNQGPAIRSLIQVKALNWVGLLGTDAGMAPDSGDVQFTVRPNPASNVAALTVKVQGPTECPSIQYELYDTAGRRLLLGTSDLCEFTVPIESFMSGNYIMRFKFNGTYYDVPVIIAR